MSDKKISFWHPASLICTCFGVGKIPFAPGTWGSLFGLLLMAAYVGLAMALLSAGSYAMAENAAAIAVVGLVLLVIILFFVGVWVSNIYERKTGSHDSKCIVIDEVVGQSITVIASATVFAMLQDGSGLNVNRWLALGVIFVTFRFFDIVKRGPVGWIDKNVKGGWGVMLDDVVAGILAGITSALIFLAI